MKKLGFGMMRVPYTDKKDTGSFDMPQINAMVDTFLDKGFTYFDTAWMYCNGKSEGCVQEAVVKRHPRASFTVTSKLPDYPLKSEADRDGIFFEQLKRTGAGYFDVYLIHAADDKNIETFEKYDCFHWLMDKKKAGLVKHCGFSFHGTPALLERLLTDYPEMEYVQLQINYLDWDDPKIQSGACYAVAKKFNKKIIVMEPIKGGKLAKLPAPAEALLKQARPELTPAAWALSFVAGLENVEMVLSGMSTLEQLKQNCDTMLSLQPLSEAEIALLKQAAVLIRENTYIPCTGCAYCMAKCPLGIRIPELFAVYNADKLEGTFSGKEAHIAEYKSLSEGAAPESCLDCGACEAICPQHIGIREWMKKVTEHFHARMDS